MNDLKLSSTKTSDLKYVDDITFFLKWFHKMVRSSDSQLLRDNIDSWPVAKDMRLRNDFIFLNSQVHAIPEQPLVSASL